MRPDGATATANAASTLPETSVVTMPSPEKVGSSVPSARSRATKKSVDSFAAPATTILPSGWSAAAWAAPIPGATMSTRPSPPPKLGSSAPFTVWRLTSIVSDTPPTVTTLLSGCTSSATFAGRNNVPLPYGPKPATTCPGNADAAGSPVTAAMQLDVHATTANTRDATRRRIEWPPTGDERRGETKEGTDR